MYYPKVYNQDCIEGMKRLDDKSIDLILTDLPYGTMSYKQDKQINLDEMWEQFRRILKPHSVVALFANTRFTIELAASNLEWYKYKWVWVKNFTTNFINCKNRPMSTYEEILIFSNGVCVHKGQSDDRMNYYPQGLKQMNKTYCHSGKIICMSSGRHNHNSKKKFGTTIHTSPSNVDTYTQTVGNYPKDVLYFDAPSNNNRYHPNQKPVDLLEYMIKTYTLEGQVVLDATTGSASTAIAAMNTNRQFIGYELDEKYFDKAVERIGKEIANKKASLF